jgi:Ricin-type beta-trefoil lectin domain-like
LPPTYFSSKKQILSGRTHINEKSRWRIGVALAATPMLALALAVPATAAAPQQEAVPMAVGSRIINGDGDTAGKCLEIANGGTSRGVQMAGCHTNAHQSWYFRGVGDGWFEIRSHDLDDDQYP